MYKIKHLLLCVYFIKICTRIHTVGVYEMNKMPTREDVARAAGVSVASVSRAVNNTGYVKKDIKEKIIQIASEMGYNPNPIAVSLQSRKTRQLLLYQNDLTAPFNIQFFKGAAQAAYKRNYNIYLDVLCDFAKITERMVDGVMFSIDILAERYLAEVGKKNRLPVVTAVNDLSQTFSHPVYRVMIDNQKIVNLAIDYLHERGHRNIGLVIPGSEYGRVRYSCWKSYMNEEKRLGNVLGDIDALVVRSEFDGEGVKSEFAKQPILYQAVEEDFEYYLSIHAGRRAAMKYVNSKNPATAFLCFNDDMAYGFISGLTRLGIRVPDDISVMGIDGIYLRSWFDVKLTTVSTEPEKVGGTCTDILIDLLENKKPKHTKTTKPVILEGETVRDLRTRKEAAFA